jgi:hypothetical protein
VPPQKDCLSGMIALEFYLHITEELHNTWVSVSLEHQEIGQGAVIVVFETLQPAAFLGKLLRIKTDDLQVWLAVIVVVSPV